MRRGSREGFKAGGLRYATERATGEFVAIFDADFVIRPSFLRDTIDHFNKPEIGAIQARWNYVNCDEKLFTRLQANKLDLHQMFEQTARARTQRPVMFHGTAGVWRVETLEAAGCWNCETEVEDMEISIRAALKGWEVLYLDHLRVSSELPETVKGFVVQQMRWRRGGTRVTRIYTRDILKADVDLRTKFDLMVRVHITWGPVGALVMTLAVLPFFMMAEKHDFVLPAALLYLSGLVIALITRYFENATLDQDPAPRPELSMHPLLYAMPLN